MKKNTDNNVIKHRSTFAVLFYINRTKIRKDGTCQLLCKVSIDAEWEQIGTTEFILDNNGNKIPVTGEAPLVHINEETGNWEISTDGGQTWEDTGVKAEGGEGDSFFSEVYVESGILYLVLADGTVIEVPMTAELAFDFGTDEEGLYFMAGETKGLAYTMSGQESVTVNKPDGWRVSFQGSSLSVTAPAEENVYAETEGAISVILISASG